MFPDTHINKLLMQVKIKLLLVAVKSWSNAWLFARWRENGDNLSIHHKEIIQSMRRPVKKLKTPKLSNQWQHDDNMYPQGRNKS